MWQRTNYKQETALTYKETKKGNSLATRPYTTQDQYKAADAALQIPAQPTNFTNN